MSCGVVVVSGGTVVQEGNKQVPTTARRAEMTSFFMGTTDQPSMSAPNENYKPLNFRLRRSNLTRLDEN